MQYKKISSQNWMQFSKPFRFLEQRNKSFQKSQQKLLTQPEASINATPFLPVRQVVKKDKNIFSDALAYADESWREFYYDFKKD